MAPLGNAIVDQGAPGSEGVSTLGASLPGSTSPRIGGSLKARRFGLILSAITLGALALRVAYVLTVTRHQHGSLYDSFWYDNTTIGLRSGQFFRAPFSLSPSAAHPPMTSLLLGAAAYIVGLHGGATSSLLVMAVLGAAVVFCVGLLGRTVAGPWVGLTAAGLAARRAELLDAERHLDVRDAGHALHGPDLVGRGARHSQADRVCGCLARPRLRVRSSGAGRAHFVRTLLF